MKYEGKILFESSFQRSAKKSKRSVSAFKGEKLFKLEVGFEQSCA